MYTHRVSIRVRYAETDQMGVVHHAVYPVWFEAARSGLFRDNGLPYSSFEKEGVLVLVTHMECSFLRPARYDDLVEVEAVPRHLTPVRFSVEYVVYQEDRTVIATGSTGHAFADRTGRPINLKKTRFWEPLTSLLPEAVREGSRRRA